MSQKDTQFNDLSHALREAHRYPLLRPAEERRLAVRWRTTHDPAAAERLIGSHLRLVIKIARRMGGYGVPIDDLIAEGNAGLMQALRKFEPERGFRFATYAIWWIKAAMQEYVVRNRSIVKMGTTAAQKRLFFNLRRVKAQIGEVGEGDLPAEAAERVAAELDVGVAEVVTMNRRLSTGDQSLATPIASDREMTWQDTLEAPDDDQESTTSEASDLAWRRDLLGRGMAVLNDRERHILRERRLKDEPTTLGGLGEIYGVSRERIRQIEVRAFEKLQRATLAAAHPTGRGHQPNA